MVKLYNFSRYSDGVLLPLLTSAKLLAGAKGDIIVKVTRGGYRVTSHAASCVAVRRFALSARRCTKASDGEDLKRGWVNTDGGWVTMQPLTKIDPLASAEHFFKTAVHEFAHIVQFQTHLTMNGTPLINSRHSRGPNGRRPSWKRRPEEIDAVNRTDEAMGKLRGERQARIQEQIIALAIEMEKPPEAKV